MEKVFVFAIIIVFGCSEEYVTINKVCSPFRMTISDAIPVQFWVNGVETYNQKEVCGITQACYCQPFNSDDEIRIQIQDSDFDSFKLAIISQSVEITRLDFSETASNVFDISFVCSDLGITNEQIHLKIIGFKDLINAQFNSDISSWTQIGSGDTWVWANDAGDGSANVQISSAQTKYFAQSIEILTGDIISSELELHSIGAIPATVDFKTVLIRSDNSVSIIDSQNLPSGPADDLTNVFTVGITVSENFSYFGFLGSRNGGSSAAFYIHYVNFTLERVMAISDCIDVKESHECTQLIRYKNAKDFAGIEYTTFSPAAEFYKRIPAIFYHETNTEEQERFETSGQTIVRLRDEIKVKRLLEIGFMPDHEHRKLLLILAHDTIEIDGETWVRNDPYEKVEGNRRYPLKKANVLLTQQGYIKRNIL